MTDPRYKSYTIELTWSRGEWHATVTRMDDGVNTSRYFSDISVEALLDAQVAGWIGGYDD